jgi:large subunit ribosomal protein L4
MALASRLADDEVKLIEAISVTEPKTGPVAKMLSALGVSDATVLVASEKHDANFWKSARNIEGVSVAPVAELNAWSILRPRAIVMTRAALDAFRESAKAVSSPARAPRRSAARAKPAGRAVKSALRKEAN